MPIRRNDNGEIMEEPTEVVEKPRPQDTQEASEFPEDRQSSSPQREDSLFEPRGGGGEGAERFEEPTVPMRRGGAEGRTRIVAPRRSRSDAAAEPPLDAPDPMSDPPVGWLVVVRGPGKGSAVSVGNGMNVIGRGPDARVRIDFGDDTIARANHARVVYEPRRRCYLLNHGDGSNLTYLNGEVVMGTVEIESGAMIELGETTLRFQAFCSQDFDWPDVAD